MALKATGPRLYSRQFTENVTVVILELLLVETDILEVMVLWQFLRPLTRQPTHLLSDITGDKPRLKSRNMLSIILLKQYIFTS